MCAAAIGDGVPESGPPIVTAKHLRAIWRAGIDEIGGISMSLKFHNPQDIQAAADALAKRRTEMFFEDGRGQSAYDLELAEAVLKGYFDSVNNRTLQKT